MIKSCVLSSIGHKFCRIKRETLKHNFTISHFQSDLKEIVLLQVFSTLNILLKGEINILLINFNCNCE